MDQLTHIRPRSDLGYSTMRVQKNGGPMVTPGGYQEHDHIQDHRWEAAAVSAYAPREAMLCKNRSYKKHV